MSEIVLARIDDRLIHGQIMTSWLQYSGGNHIVIVDNGTAKDSFLQSIMKMSIPSGIKLSVFDEPKGADYLKKENKGDKILILTKTPETYLNLVNNGVNLSEIIVGGMGAKEGRTQFYKNISVSEAEKNTFKKLMDKGIKVKVQVVPSDQAKNVSELL